jgi:GDPmannose 4,6-dehydratase
MKRVIVVGSAGQDGRILLERMRGEGRLVLGLDQRGVEGTDGDAMAPIDILDAAAVEHLLAGFQADAIYYLAAFHHSSEESAGNDRELFQKSFDINVFGVLNFLEAMRKISPRARLFYAASSHVFGACDGPRQDETTPFNPDSVYGITKAAGANCARFYRAAHGLYAAVGILYNHESSFRPPRFVTRKIVSSAVNIKLGRQEKLVLGDLEASVDWGYAPDYVDAMIRIMQLPEPRDFVVATGQPHTVREFVEIAFGLLGLDWRRHVEVSPALVAKPRNNLSGNSARLTAATGWKPSVSFAEMIALLVQAQERCHAAL